jgi:competence ComEA-like helix-hairpin-helix protein
MRMLIALLCAALPATIALATVNVNTAQQSDLQRTKGLDKVKAKAIIDWRNENGSIDTFLELQKVPGFTPDVIEKVKPEIAFEGDAYTPPKKEAKKKPAAAATPAPRAQASR